MEEKHCSLFPLRKYSITPGTVLLYCTCSLHPTFLIIHMRASRDSMLLIVFQDLLQHQTPDMRALSMSLPPLQKSDSVELFLKDAPQDSKLFTMSYQNEII